MVERVRASAETPGVANGRVVVFGPSPLLEVSIEPGRRVQAGPHIRVVPGGQAVWVARMASTMGSAVTVCGLAGGEVGALLTPMLARERFTTRLVTTADTGCFVVDQRHEPATEVASDWAAPPSREVVDDLVATTLDSTTEADILVVCNPMPGDALPLDTYTEVVSGAADRGAGVLVDLSTPRLDAALRGGPAMVKLNDWELAELVRAPVDAPSERGRAVRQLRGMGAQRVVETRGPASVIAVDDNGEGVELRPPVVGDGRAAGCGDAMTGAMAAALAAGAPWVDAVRRGMAAGAAHYRGRGESSQLVIEALAAQVVARPLPL